MSNLSLTPLAAANGAVKSLPTDNARQNASARESADEFEALFLAQILNSMTSGLEIDGIFGGGQAEGVYRSMLNDEYAKSISRQGGVGIADVVYREILALQEVK